MAKRRSATVGTSGSEPAGSSSTIRNGSPAVCQSSVWIQYEDPMVGISGSSGSNAG